MTIAAIAAVAKGTTKITNIANQRVKECNRIAVMVEELGKCGVRASELPDGIQVEGCAGDTSKLKGAHIACHKDHRIAMSFTVLGLRVPGIVITDRECVNKTYPEFWEHCEKILGIGFEIPMELVNGSVTEQKPVEKEIVGESLLIVGMNGSGKSTLGKALAKELKWKFIDTDDVFGEEEKCSIQEFIKKRKFLG